jgi:hypothetical protein
LATDYRYESRKIRKYEKSESFYILGYLLEPIIKIWRIIYFSWKILCIGRNHFFQVEISPKKKHLLAMILFGGKFRQNKKKRNILKQFFFSLKKIAKIPWGGGGGVCLAKFGD